MNRTLFPSGGAPGLGRRGGPAEREYHDRPHCRDQVSDSAHLVAGWQDSRVPLGRGRAPESLRG